MQYGLPTEAEWEKAARGGLIGKRYSWGDEPPDRQRCDSGHFGEFVIRPPRELAPNGYGLHAMCGCVWEWTTAPYDALAYHPRQPPTVFDPGLPRVARGGSFVDDEAAVTVSFRMALADRQVSTPTIGFRLVRQVGKFQIAAPAVVTKSSAPPPAPPPAPEAPAKPSWLSRIFGGKK